MIATLFGRPNISVHRPLHSGFGLFSRHLYGQISAEAIAKHGLMALYQTFSHPVRYEKAVEQAMSSWARAYLFLYSAQADNSKHEAYFRSTPAICRSCVEQDLKELSFSYYRRQHQVIASEYCAQHKIKLTISCAKCGSNFSFVKLPTSVCQNCGMGYAPEVIDENGDSQLSKLRLSMFISSMILGEFPQIPLFQRLAILEKKCRDVFQPSPSSSIGQCLTRYVRAIYGEDWLKTIRLLPASSETLAWPAQILYGVARLENPIANAILAAALWESIDEYRSDII